MRFQIIIIALMIALSACTTVPNREEPSNKLPATACTLEYAPVCGVDGITYGNKCMAGKMKIAYQGECKTAEKTPAELCTASGATWLEQFNECESMGLDIKDLCVKLGGKFAECQSACRHNEKPGLPCVAVCMRVCSLNSTEENSSIKSPLGACTMEYNPVCGVDGITFGNVCTAGDVKIAYNGECKAAEKPVSQLCAEFNGNWIEKTQECLRISSAKCTTMQGKFDECPPCLSTPGTGCVDVCVPTCSFI